MCDKKSYSKKSSKVGKTMKKTMKKSIKRHKRDKDAGLLGTFIDRLPYAQNFYTKFHYVGSGELATTNNSPVCGNTTKFRLNSPYDPYMGTTGQNNVVCAGFNQLLSASGPWTRYKPLGVHIKVSFRPPLASNAQLFGICNILTANDTFDIQGYTVPAIGSRPNCKALMLGNYSNKPQVAVNAYFPMHKLFEITKEQYRADITTTTAPYNNNPASLVELDIGACDDNAGSSTDINYEIELIYYCQLYERFVPNL